MVPTPCLGDWPGNAGIRTGWVQRSREASTEKGTLGLAMQR